MILGGSNEIVRSQVKADVETAQPRAEIRMHASWTNRYACCQMGRALNNLPRILFIHTIKRRVLGF